MPPRWLDRAGKALCREDQCGQLVVLPRVTRNERALSDVVEIRRKRDVARLGTDVCAHSDDRLSDAPDEQTVRAQPVRICVPVKKDLRLRRYLRQLGVRI